MEKNLFENLKKVLYTYRGRFIRGFFMVLVSNFLLIFNPLVLRQAVMAMDPRLTSGWMGKYVHSLGAWVLILIMIAMTSSFLKYWMRMTFITVSRDIERDVRLKIFERIQSQSMAFYDRHGVGELISRLTNDISAYRDVLGPGIMYPLFFLTIMIPGFIGLFTISISLALVSIIPLIAVPILNWAFRKKIYILARSVQKLLGELSNMVQEHFSSIRIIKSYGIESLLTRKFKFLNRELMQSSLQLSYMENFFFPLFLLLTRGTTVLLVFLAAVLILREWYPLNAADFVSFMWIQSYIFFPILMLGWLLPVYQRGRAAYDRLVEIYEEPVEVVGAGNSLLRIPDRTTIEIKDLTFTYPAAKAPALNRFSLRIQGGSFMGITGPIGGGKTTLFRLLSREYEVPEGKILIDGRDIHDYPLKAFHEHIVTVEQLPFLFSRSIAENVRFGRREASLDEIELVSQFADFHETVLDFPEKYDTVIGERGVTLSGGQKQRLAMARAFLVNRSTLLLDDIFSNIDAGTEKRIFQSIQENFRGKTVVLVTHRMSVLEKMDQVVFLANGKVLEQGTHRELMAIRGHYAALVELQRIDL